MFTVAEGRTVRFSRGNLQYRASTGTWRFAEHQYDYVGADNQNISSTYTGWIDLFGWGTSGWNSGAVAYQPWATSTTYSDYYPGGSYTNSLTGACANADWAVNNAISNGGNQAGMWRTITKDEWSYLLFSRNASSVSGTENARYAKCKVGSVQGLMVFPDSFSKPAGLADIVNINTSDAAFDGNSYTTEQWSQLEASGAVFLPAAGLRYVTGVSNAGTYGYYWSSTCDDVHYAWYMSFYSGNVLTNYGSRGFGFSVCPVRD